MISIRLIAKLCNQKYNIIIKIINSINLNKIVLMAERKSYDRNKKRKRCLTPEIFKHYQDSKYYYLGNMFVDSEDTILSNKSNKNILGLHKSFNRKSDR